MSLSNTRPTRDAYRGLPVYGFGRPAQMWDAIGTWSDPETESEQPIVSLYLLDVGEVVPCQRVRLSVDRCSARYVGPAGGGAYGIKLRGVA